MVRRAVTGSLDANFFGLVTVALLPSLIYLFGVTTWRSSAIYGLLPFGITALGWVPVFLVDDAMRGVWTFPAFFITLTTSLLGAIDDRRRA